MREREGELRKRKSNESRVKKREDKSSLPHHES
jgi:hypothetical protein